MRYTLLLMLLTLFGFQNTYASMPTPVGYWQTIDDVTGKVKSIIHITENDQHVLSGRIVKIYPKPGKDEHEVCDQCKGDKYNKPIVGMVILTNLTYDDDQWENGKILDPSTGKTYSCTLKAYEDGKRLLVHGYIGFALLGRSQTWIRTSDVK